MTSYRATKSINASDESYIDKVDCFYIVRFSWGYPPVGTRSVNACYMAECSSVALEFLRDKGKDGGEELSRESDFELIFCCSEVILALGTGIRFIGRL